MSTELVSISNYDRSLVESRFREKVAEWRRDVPAFVRDTFRHGPTGSGSVTVDSEQSRIFTAITNYDRVAVRSGRGVGKTAGSAIIVPWWLSTRYPATVVTSAGTWGHLEDKLWPEILLWSRQWILSTAYEYQTMGIYHRREPEALRAVATSSDKPTNVEGYHSPHLLLLIDEAKGMPDEIYDALIASLTGNEDQGEQKVIALSTPPLSKQGWFARVSSSSEWEVVHISGLDSPRVSRSWVEEMRTTYGESSPEYQSYVLGNIPEFTSDTVIPLSWFEACQQLLPCSTRNNTRRPVITCDVAREGDDLTTFGVLDRASFDLVRFADGRPGWTAKKDLMETVGRCVQALKLYPRTSAICIDDTGLGGGVTDRLRELQYEGKISSEVSILGVKFGSKPSRVDRFKQKKDELWWSAREVIRQQLIALPSDDHIRSWRCPRGSDFKVQVTSALYEYNSIDQIDVLDKRVSNREKTMSLPTKSPDLAHALILGVRYYLRQSEDKEMEEAAPKSQGESLFRRIQEEVENVTRPKLQDPYRRNR